MKFIIASSNVAGLIGKHPYLSTVDALRKELERNQEILNEIMDIAGVRYLPNVTRAVKEVYEKASPSEITTAEVITPEMSSTSTKDLSGVDPSIRNIVDALTTNIPIVMRGIEMEKKSTEGMERCSTVTKYFDPKISKWDNEIKDGDIGLVGVADAMFEGKVVEVKTRKARFMSPEYDIIQLTCYVWLYGVEAGILKQRANGLTQSTTYTRRDLEPRWSEMMKGLSQIYDKVSKALTNIEFANALILELYPGSIQKGGFPIKLIHPEAKIPTRGTIYSAGYDLYAVEGMTVEPGKRALVRTGICIKIDEEGIYGRIAPRSGLALRHGITVGAGVIDADYQAEIGVLLFNHGEDTFKISPGDRIAQIIFERYISPGFRQVTEMESNRGGFGSTGK